MPTSMTRIGRQTRAELLFLYFSRRLVLVLAALGVGVVVSFTGSVSAASSANADFVRQVAAYEEHGVSLADALRAPTSVTRSGSSETIDNPLKHDYLGVARSVAALRGTAMAGTALDLSTFIVMPLLFLVLGSGIADHDRSSGSSQLRAARERWGTVVAAKALVIGVVALVSSALVAAGGLVASAVGSGRVRSLRGGISYDLVAMTPSPLLPKLAMSAAVAAVFGLAGYVTGWLCRSTSWPMVAAALTLFVVPFVSPWDPRNVVAVLGGRVFDFWGQFQLRPPLELAHGRAIAAAVVYTAVVIAGVAASARRVPLR